MTKYYIKISWHDSFHGENESKLVEVASEENPLVCSFEEGRQNLKSIQENIELEAATWNNRGLKSTQERSQLIEAQKGKRWFWFDSFIGLLNEDGTLDTAIDASELDAYTKKGRKAAVFYIPNFYAIKLLGGGKPVICDTFWHNNEHCNNYSAELVKIIPLEEKLKITW